MYASYMMQAVVAHPALASLELSGCKLRAECGPALAGVVSGSTGLTHLGLAKNQLGDRGSTALAGALACNTALTSLDLRSNTIGLTGEAEPYMAFTFYRIHLICGHSFSVKGLLKPAGPCDFLFASD